MAALVLRWLLSLALMAARLWDDWLRFCLAMELGRALVAVEWFAAAVRRFNGHERRWAAHGAVALLDVVDLSTLDSGPACRPEISPHLFAAIVRRWSPARAWVEWIGLRAGDRPTGAFSFGASKAMVEMTLAVLGAPFRTVTPAARKRAAGIPPGRDMKDLARDRAIERWPEHAELFARKFDHDRDEAALIGWAGIQRERAGR